MGCKCKDQPGLPFDKVKDLVVTQVVHRTVTEHAETLQGEFLPLSVYRAKGYSEAEVSNIASNCAWYHCNQLQVPVYCLRVLSSFHKEARVKAEEEWLQAERAVKKRKGAAGVTAPAEGDKAVADDGGQPSDSAETQQADTQAQVVQVDLDLVDLCTDSEEEKQAELKKRKLSQEEKKAARAEATAAKKAENEAKKKRRQENKKTASFAAKACADLLKAVDKTKTALAAAKKKNKSELLVQGLEAQLTEQQTWRKQYLKVVSDFTLDPAAELQCPLDSEALKAALTAGAELAQGSKGGAKPGRGKKGAGKGSAETDLVPEPEAAQKEE